MGLRTVVERLSRRVVLKRRLPKRCGGGTIYVSPDAALRFWRRDLEAVHKGLFDWAERFVREGHVVWDVGANVGLFTFAAAHQAGPSGLVVAIEPDTFLVDLLLKTARQQRDRAARTIVLPAAASDCVGVTTLCIAARNRASNYLETAGGRSQTGGVRETVSAMSVTLDWLGDQLPRPNVLKIDVEGAEHRVLKGGEKLLREARPIILCEVGGPQREATSELLRAAGYRLFDLQNHGQGALTIAAHNTLAVPESDP